MQGLPGLKKRRLKAGLTQKALADLVGINAISISRYELGNQNARFRVITQLANILGCTEQELLFPSVSSNQEDSLVSIC